MREKTGARPVQMNFRIPANLKKEIIDLAAHENVSVSRVMARALRYRIARMKARKAANG